MPIYHLLAMFLNNAKRSVISTSGLPRKVEKEYPNGQTEEAPVLETVLYSLIVCLFRGPP